MFFNPRYGHVGLFAIPFYFFTEVIPPFIELAGYAVILTGLFVSAIPAVNIVHFAAVTWLYGAANSFIALVIEHFAAGGALRFHHFLAELCASLLDNLFYRQINLVFRVTGVFRFFTKKREWGEMKRSGYK
jgi:hypothetical protein